MEKNRHMRNAHAFDKASAIKNRPVDGLRVKLGERPANASVFCERKNAVP